MICLLINRERDIETYSPNTIKLLPWQSNFSLLPGDVGGLLRSFHSSVHLLSDLTGPKGDQVLPLPTNQDVLLVLSFFFRAIWKRGTAVAMALVAEPFPFILEPIRSPTHTKPCPLVVLPLPAVGLSCRGVHIIICDCQLCIRIAKTGKGKKLHWFGCIQSTVPHISDYNEFREQQTLLWQRSYCSFNVRGTCCPILHSINCTILSSQTPPFSLQLGY